jgi:hypothetical protein
MCAMNPRLLVPRATFDPRSIAGLIGWWDFSDATLLRQTLAGATAVTDDGDVVGYAIDKSGNDRPMAANNNARRPVYKTNILNGKSGLRFDGADDALAATTHSGTAPDAQTWFGVFANISTATFGTRFFARDSLSGLFVNSGVSPMRAEYFLGATSTFTTPVIAIGDAIYSVTFPNTSECVVRQNGSLNNTIITPNGEYRTATGLRVGANNPDGGNATACDCLEVLIWHFALSAAQRSLVEKYLARKYGLTLA